MSSHPSKRQRSAFSREAEQGTFSVAKGESGPKWAQMGRLLTDWQFASRIVRKRLGLPVPMDTEDRRVLEQIIFPCYTADESIRTVLFVGCDWYTRHYERSFFSAQDYWTLEFDPEKRKFGARQHIVGALESLAVHFPAGKFDLILCNGVYGWGLNRREDIESAFAQCHQTLRSGGHFMIGWDDIPERAPVPLEQIESLQRFHPCEHPILHSWRYLTDTPYRHTYDFYRK